jgi:adenylate kinase family enzyme
VKTYLENRDIPNPNLFPAAALPALNIRMIANGAEVDEDTVDETELKVKKLNRNEDLHLEKYASLPAGIKAEINDRLSAVKEAKEAEREALIHTGVVSIEAAIRQYVQKYAKTAKIKNIVDTFVHKLEAAECFEETKKELASRQDENDRIVRQIEWISQKIDDVKEAQRFQDAVDDAVVKVNDDAREVVETILATFMAKMKDSVTKFKGKELTIDEAESETQTLKNFVEKLELEFQEELDELITKTLVNTGNVLLTNYRQKLASLTSQMDEGTMPGISIEPLKLMSGNVADIDSFSLNNLIQTKKVENGEEWVKNTHRKWYKPWTLFQKKGYYRTKYKDVEYVDRQQLYGMFFMPVENEMRENGESAIKYVLQQSKKISESFNKEFKRLDGVLQSKLEELKSCATDKEQAEARIKESERRLAWLVQIKNEVESILEI